MSREELMIKIATGTPDELARVAGALAGQSNEAPSLRLLTMTKAAEALDVSRVTIWRLIRDGRLRAVEVRNGSHRIPEIELRRFAGV